MRERILGLDAVRAAAITLVVVGHWATFHSIWSGGAGWPIHFGAVGVNLFFALSGYLIGGILLRLGESLSQEDVLRRFWLRRWLRTLPSYYLFILLNLAWWYGLQQARLHSSESALPFALRCAFFVQNLTHRGSWFFPESWSLAVEEWFYLLAPAGLFFLLRRGMRLTTAYATCVASLLAVSLISRVWLTTGGDWERDVHEITLGRLDAVAWGLMAAAIARAHPTQWRRLRVPLAVLGLGLLVESIFIMAKAGFGASALATLVLPSLLPFAGALLLPWASTQGPFGGAAVTASIQALARWSYALYLVNLPVSVVLLARLTEAAGPWAAFSGYIVGCLTLSAGLYHFFEAPLLRWRERQFPDNPEPAIASASSAKP